MIDLHTHTDESDGSYSPQELIETAAAAGIRTLAITDHDTLQGYEKAYPFAQRLSVRLIRGIELNTRHAGRSIHLLAYFVTHEPGFTFLAWLEKMVAARRERNQHLIGKLNSLGVDIRLEEVEALGRSLTGRPHFARVLVNKGYVANRDEAFSRYIGESGAAYVERDSPTLEEAIAIVHGGGGITSLAHPIRLGYRDPAKEETLIGSFRHLHLDCVEVFHTDHTPADTARYMAIVERYGFGFTGGSDFHGSYKPNARLGYGDHGQSEIPAAAAGSLLALAR